MIDPRMFMLMPSMIVALWATYALARPIAIIVDFLLMVTGGTPVHPY
jgi:hypothetical protein